MQLTKDDVLKIKAVVLYIVNKCETIDFIHLFKIIYFAERKQYATYGQHLIADSFCALYHGPVPSFLYDALKCVVGKKYINQPYIDIITSVLKRGYSECDSMVRAIEKPDMDELSIAEIEALDESYNNNIYKSPWQLSQESHDSAWDISWKKGSASVIDPLLIAKAGGASKGFVEYIAESEKINQVLHG